MTATGTQVDFDRTSWGEPEVDVSRLVSEVELDERPARADKVMDQRIVDEIDRRFLRAA